jgi:hypothetical protein
VTPGTRNDGLRLELSAAEIVSLRTSGTLPGVVVLAAAARNGPGTGRLTASSQGIAWMAPGSTQSGTPVATPIDGAYLLEDGSDASKWVRVQVYAEWLGKSGGALVQLKDWYNALGPADVPAADALAGATETTEYQLVNLTGNAIVSAILWLDSACAPGISVSQDGTNFFTPSSSVDPNALAWASIAAGASVNLWVKRVISATSASNPRILNALQWAWIGY